MTRSERIWVLAYSAVLAAVTSMPYLIGVRSQGENFQFTGFLFGVEDGNSYIAKMLTGYEGTWLFRTPYTTAEQPGVVAFLPYLLLGKIVGGSHGFSVLGFHALRVAAIPLMVMAAYRFVGLFAPQTEWRRWAVALASAGGGLGWVAIVLGAPDWLGSPPLEFYSPETFGFLATYGLPHLLLARAGLLASLSAYLGPSNGWVAGGLLLLAGLIHPPVLLTGLAVLGAHQIAALGFAANGAERFDHLRRLGRTVLPTLPLLIYLGAAYALDPYLRAWAEQNIIRSPNPLHYLLGYGAVLPIAISGGSALLRRRSPTQLLPVTWVMILPMLAYAPLNIQRRLPEAGWVALLAMAAVGAQLVPRRSQPLLRVGLTALLLPSTLLILIGGIQTASRPGQPAFRPTSEVAAFEWLNRNAVAGEVVLAAYETGNALPAWAPLRVVVGHGPESIGLAELRPEVEAFFASSSNPGERLGLLEDQRVDYLFYGPAERALDGWDPRTWDCLEPLYARAEYAIYSTCVQSDG